MHAVCSLFVSLAGSQVSVKRIRGHQGHLGEQTLCFSGHDVEPNAGLLVVTVHHAVHLQ